MNTTGAPLTDKVALITGGARRLGAHIARVLHNEGMNLLLHYRTSVTEARGLQEELNAKRAGSVLLVGSDLLNLAKLDRLVDQATESFGRLDVLVNNASSFYATPIGETPKSSGLISSEPISKRLSSWLKPLQERLAKAKVALSI